MKGFLANLLPRLKEYSQSLDKIELFVEQPWVFIDNNLRQQKYIFKRNGELIMSHEGSVTIGQWEYIPSAKSLLIDRKTDKILLNQNFINNAVMILKRDGINNENFILANENILPDLDVENYMKRLFYKKYNIKLGKMKNGDKYEFHFRSSGELDYGIEVTVDGGKEIPDQILTLISGKKVQIKNNKIIQIFDLIPVDTNLGRIYVEKFKYLPGNNINYNTFYKGSKVYDSEGKFARDGRYKIGLFKSILVENGIIVS